MQDKPVILVTGSNKVIGLQIAKDLAPHGFTMLVSSRDLKNGEAAHHARGHAWRVVLTKSMNARSGAGTRRRPG